MLQWWVVPGPDGGVLEARTVDVSSPGEGEALIAVRGAGINRGELIGRPLLRDDNPKARPFPSGIEFAGEIVAVGPGLTSWAPGDRVMGRGQACHSEYTIAPLDSLMAIPGHLTTTEAAAIPNVFVTAHDALVTTARTGPTDRVLITAGSSGVGSAALQIARYLGCRTVVATTRSPAKARQLELLGATMVADTNEPDWVGRLGDTGGFDVVIDQVGAPLFGCVLQAMALKGRYVSVGRTGGKSAAVDLDLVARKRLELIGVTFRTRTRAEALACSKRFAERLLPAFESGQLAPVLDRTFPLDALPDAQQYMASDDHVGKVVLATTTQAI